MSKRGQARQIRQVRKVKPKGLPAQAPNQGTPQQQKKQRERYVQSGGLLQGYAPDLVLRVSYLAAAGAVVCLLVAAAILLLPLLLPAFLPYGWPVRAVAAAVWLVPIVFAASFVLPAFRLARRDGKEEPKLIRGQLLGASPVSTSFGLGMLMLQTRAGSEQYLVPTDRLARVPGNQVPVMLTMTPNLRHVRSVGVMGQRMVAMPQQQVPEVVKRLRLMPIATPAALSLGAIVGGDAVAFAPIPGGDVLHGMLAAVAALVLAGGVYGISFLFQKRMYAEVQSLLPGGL
jgi:hypothetical protein